MHQNIFCPLSIHIHGVAVACIRVHPEIKVCDGIKGATRARDRSREVRENLALKRWKCAQSLSAKSGAPASLSRCSTSWYTPSRMHSLPSSGGAGVGVGSPSISMRARRSAKCAGANVSTTVEAFRGHGWPGGFLWLCACGFVSFSSRVLYGSLGPDTRWAGPTTVVYLRLIGQAVHRWLTLSYRH